MDFLIFQYSDEPKRMVDQLKNTIFDLETDLKKIKESQLKTRIEMNNNNTTKL